MAFHEQFYRVKPEMTINDLVEVKQYEHEFTEDFMIRFKKTRIRCQFPINHAQLISMAQKALRLPLRKKFYDYERLLIEEQQVKHSSKVPYFYKNKAAIHQIEFERAKPEKSDGHGEEGIEMRAAEMNAPFKPLTRVVMNDGGFVPMKPLKYQSYSFDLTKASEIYEELVRTRVIVPDNIKKMPKPEELRGKKYCKLHYTFNHFITNYVQFKDWIQDLIANMRIDMDPFLEARINMINLTWVEKGKGKPIWEVKAKRRQVDRLTKGTIKLPEKPKVTIVKGLILCSKCQCECELEMPASEVIIDQELIRRREKEEQETRRSIMRAAENETSRNPKNLSNVFRNNEASEEVEDKEAKIPKWVEVRPSQPSYEGGNIRM
ncbi:S2-RNase [Pyrus ussuriensis x Pyrus communis]|uniref:S2-RNase n=1 Tax=Pyrus ussuriensis x Pyrus communis TaxID=2448454 RepID=A0A5N5G0P7_9ROSA|nr:S2-RNase [Pyrus ussuriensis x Pyrus communis]KAB2608946.1 S2-RNase [Pyrus ussuriensis x Pyrus communis]